MSRHNCFTIKRLILNPALASQQQSFLLFFCYLLPPRSIHERIMLWYHTSGVIAVCVSEGWSPGCIFMIPPCSKTLFSPLFCHSVLRRRSWAVSLSCHLLPPWLLGATGLTFAFIPMLHKPLIGLGHNQIIAVVCLLAAQQSGKAITLNCN